MAKTAKKSFVFNCEWSEVLVDYPAEVRLEVYEAVIRYAASGTLPELRPLAKMAFSFIKKEIDYNNERYNEIVAKRSAAGKKGMDKMYACKDNKRSVTKLTSDNKTNKSYQKITNVTDNDNDNDNDNKEIVSTNVEPIKKSTDVLKESHTSTRYENFISWMKENTPTVLKLKTGITEEQFAKIRKQYEFEQIASVLQSMENHKELTKKYTSAYLTFIKWAKREYGDKT